MSARELSWEPIRQGSIYLLAWLWRRVQVGCLRSGCDGGFQAGPAPWAQMGPTNPRKPGVALVRP
jgi:hypothetical protein